MTKAKRKIFISGIPYCGKCKEPLNEIKLVTNTYPIIFGPDKEQAYYCLNEYCDNFGLLTVVRIKE